MKISNLTCWLLGGWIAGSLFMILVATQNFRSVDRLLAAPAGTAPQIERMGRDEARVFLRYQVSEQNRHDRIDIRIGRDQRSGCNAKQPGIGGEPDPGAEYD